MTGNTRGSTPHPVSVEAPDFDAIERLRDKALVVVERGTLGYEERRRSQVVIARDVLPHLLRYARAAAGLLDNHRMANAYLIRDRDALKVRAEKAEARIGELEEAFSLVSDEGDALNDLHDAMYGEVKAERDVLRADLTRAREEAVGEHRANVKLNAEIERAREEAGVLRSLHEADHKSMVDLMDENARLREALGIAWDLLDVGDKYITNPRQRQFIKAARSLLSVSTSAETSPAREISPEDQKMLDEAAALYRAPRRAPENTPQEEKA